MVYYDFLSYDFVTRQFVYFCRFQVIYLLFLALVPLLGPPILSKVCQVVDPPSFFFGRPSGCPSLIFLGASFLPAWVGFVGLIFNVLP